MDGWVIYSIIVTIAFIIIAAIALDNQNDISGFIIIDKYDPDGPYMFLELGEDVDSLCERDIAMLGIIVRDPSQD